ncbi:efflux RND transporter periplasmic adaptor subunit [Mariprofundus erugo]|uniref:Efflux RND transporter periplasmic adaptor subunit n=1 Tax=Mariprofundus erugo TaxID=2528639 RepID=A0A5R9GQ11_9PROT|nr:efflux RND transporter periplasmic adaptor subunit [Mariprofundus erugo]TLS67019.1 efflux RND transporter periplasmic adaptor subunit [Mariprofundus erugo]
MNKPTVVIMVVVLLSGLAGGYGFSSLQQRQEVQATVVAPVQKKPAYYRNPMNPAITSAVPAKDEMGMDYIPVYADGEGDRSQVAGTVAIDPVTVQNIGVRTVRVTEQVLAKTLRTVGRITYDEERVARLHPKVEGWVEKMFVDKTGEHVKSGDMLLAVYSPQLVSSAEEYVLALNSYDTLKNNPFPDIREGAKRLMQSARQRLELLDLPVHQLRDIERTRKVARALHIHTPVDGTIMNIGVREGSRITPDTELYMVADLSRIWVLVDIYEDDIPWVRVGDMAEMNVAAVAGRSYRGRVNYIYPYLDARTRTLKVRLEFDNADLALKPDMFANITLYADHKEHAVVVPAEAIVRTGTGSQVFLVRAPGKFEPREVTTGIASGGMVQILSGLEPGDEVVASSQFLIDSESKLKEATAKMLEPVAPAPDAGMDMGDVQLDDPGHSGMSMEMPAGQEQAPALKQHSMDSDMNMDGMQMGGGK